MKFICLLRGINVSGKKLIKMELLRGMFEQMGFADVQTYIQSGNIIFETIETGEIEIKHKIENGLKTILGYQVVSFIRNFNTWDTIIRNNPFPGQTGNPDYKFYVTFLNQEPETNLAEKLLSFCSPNETYVLKGRELYVLLRKDTATKEVFSNNFVENKLKMPATTRNWNTILKIMDYKK
jgi:uncharacterized protein (DUF1697 family)